MLCTIGVLFWAPPSRAKDWKIFCMPEKHLDVGWSYLPAEAQDQGYPGSVEEYQVFTLILQPPDRVQVIGER